MSDLAEVERVAGLSDAVMRNLLITQCYHELSLRIASRTGPCANWCTFAAWASKQAGRTIRKEDLSRALDSAVDLEKAGAEAARTVQNAARRLGLRINQQDLLTLLWKAYDPQAAFERSGAAVARGNLKVFSEIARAFAQFCAERLADPVYDPAAIDQFSQRLRPGDPPEGQGYLRLAFGHLYRALFEIDESIRAQLILLSNLLIGYHEQVRLQPDILEALSAPVVAPRDFARRLIEALDPGGWAGRCGWTALRWLGWLTDFDRAAAVYTEGAQRQVQYVVTQSLMSIDLAGRRLPLSADVPGDFPPALRRLTQSDLLDLLARIDPTPDSPLQSGARFWGDLPERIHFIADMFRRFETEADLLGPPFTAEQTRALKEGRLPEGSL